MKEQIIVEKIEKKSVMQPKLQVYLFAEGMIWGKHKVYMEIKHGWNSIRVIEHGKEYFINFNLKEKKAEIS